MELPESEKINTTGRTVYIVVSSSHMVEDIKVIPLLISCETHWAAHPYPLFRPASAQLIAI